MTRLSLKRMIMNEIDNGVRGFSEELAVISDYSSGSALRKVLKGEGKEFDKFNGLVNLVRFLFGEDEKKLMEQYSKEIDPNNKTARAMLEYLCNNRLLTSMKELIEKMLVCKNKESKEWAAVYSIQYQWQTNYYGLDVNQYLKEIREFKTNIPELKTYLNILRCYAFYYKKAHKLAYELSFELFNEIEEIKEEYLKDIYRTKINEIVSYIELRVLNNPEAARNQAEMILSSHIGETHKAYANYTIGCSYFYESYEQAKESYLKSIEIYNQIDRNNAAQDVQEILDLLNIVWGKEVPFVISPIYKAYRDIKINKCNYELSEEGLDLSYYYLLKGMKENNTEILMQSMIQFLKNGDSFFANLPKMELLNRGYSQVIINELINIYKA